MREIKLCGDTYTVMTADGHTEPIWERNLRFKTDSSEDGPVKRAAEHFGSREGPRPLRRQFSLVGKAETLQTEAPIPVHPGNAG